MTEIGLELSPVESEVNNDVLFVSSDKSHLEHLTNRKADLLCDVLDSCVQFFSFIRAG